MVLRRNPLFTGRQAELLALAGALLYQPGRSAVGAGPTAIVGGLNGIGKTQLAVEFIYRYGRFFAGGVYWLSFALPENIPSAIAACGRVDALNLHPDFDRLQLDAQVTLVQRAWQEPVPRLLVFDNCEDEALLDRWRPPDGGCRLLVTSRRQGWRRRPGLAICSLAALPRPESITLLRRFVPDLAEADAGAVAAVLGDFPLALHLAGSFLAHHGAALSPQAYLERLRQRSLPAHPSRAERGQTPSLPDHELSAIRAFALSYDWLDHAASGDVPARSLLAGAASFAPGEPIPRDLLLATLGPPNSTIWTRLRRRLWPKIAPAPTGAGVHPRAQAALDRLLQLGFLSQESNDMLRLHRLLAKFVPLLAGVAAATAAVEQALLAALSNRIDRAGYLGPLPTLAIHLRVITDRARPRRDTAAASLCNQLGYYLHERGEYAAARNYLEQAVAIRRRLLGRRHPATATSLNNLGLLLQDMGNHDAARGYLEQALAIFRQVLGQQHLQTAGSLNNLGFLLRAMGDNHGARNYFEQALAIQSQLLGPQHLDTAQSLNNLGRLLHELGDYAGARNYLERALAVYEQFLGRQHPATATALNNLGALLQDMGDLPAAQNYYQQALAIRRQLLGEQHPATIATLNHLGSLLNREG